MSYAVVYNSKDQYTVKKNHYGYLDRYFNMSITKYILFCTFLPTDPLFTDIFQIRNMSFFLYMNNGVVYNTQ